jgi:pullulanase/glycogen debranching enzyme
VTSRALVGLLALLLLLGGCAGKAPSAAGSSGTAKAQRIEVSIAKGKISGATGRVQVATGTAVTLVVTSDVADEVHLHGYDIEKELVPGKPTTLQFTATLTGVFEVELHKANVVLVHLQVG